MTDQNQSSREPTIPVMADAHDGKPAKTSGFGIASFTLGIIAMFSCGLTSFLGLIFGIVSIVQIRRNSPSLTGRFYAISGTIVNAVMLAALILLGTLRMQVQDVHRTYMCASNLKQIGLAMMMYMDENDQCLPSSEKWIGSVSRYRSSDRVLRCPSVRSPKACYAMNDGLSGTKEDTVSDPSKTVLLFDSVPGDTPHGGPELIPSPERHILSSRDEFGGLANMDELRQGNEGSRTIKVNNFCFADGHVRSMTARKVHSLIWNPAKWK